MVIKGLEHFGAAKARVGERHGRQHSPPIPAGALSKPPMPPIPPSVTWADADFIVPTRSSKRELSVSAWGAARTSSQSAMFVFDHSYYHKYNNNSSSNNYTKQQQLLLVLPILNTAIITIAPALV